MANNKEVNDTQALKNIADLLGLQNSINDEIENDIYGTVKHDISMDDTKQKISSLMSDYKQSFGGNFFDNFKNMQSEFTNSEKKNLQNIKEQIENNKNVSMFQNMISGTDSLSSKYEDLKLVTNIMPQLKQARIAIVNSILSPDDFTKQISLNMDVDLKPLSTIDEVLSKTVKNIIKKYKLSNTIKYAVDRTVTLGRYYVAVLPYSKLYGEMINRKEKGTGNLVNGLYGETVDVLSEETQLQEYVKSMPELKTNIKSILENTVITNESLNLFDEDILEQELLLREGNDISGGIFNLEKLKKVSQQAKDKKVKTDDFNVSTDGFFSKNKDPKITGAKIKKIDPRRLIPLSIDEDTNLGYYYIENNETKNMIMNSGLTSFRNGTSIKQQQSSVDLIYKNIGDLLWKKLDHKFIENHPEIKERMYDVLKYSDVNENSKLKITYLEPNEVVEFKINDGESAFESSLFFAKLYLMVLLSTITARVIRSNDVRAYYVDVDSSGGVNSMVNNAINTLQQSNRSVLSMNHITKLISNFSVFEDIFIPKSDDKKPMDFDIISGQQVDLNNDILEMLEQICVNTSGIPLQLLQSSNDVDFARTFTMLNISFMKNTLDRQMDLNPSITELIIKILETEITDKKELTIIERLECYLQSPMNLLLTNLLEQINNAKDVAQGITDIIAGQTGSDVYGDAVIDRFMLQICKKYAPNIPWEEFEELINELLLNSKKDKLDEEEPTE